jgi:hypothetical protein
MLPGGQRPSSRISASAMFSMVIGSTSHAIGDPYRTALVAISLTAITKSSARSGGRPAWAAHRAVTCRTRRRFSMPNRISRGAAISPSLLSGCGADLTLPLLPPGRPGNQTPALTSAQAVLADCPGLGCLTEPDFLPEAHIRTDGMPVWVAQATGLV